MAHATITLKGPSGEPLSPPFITDMDGIFELLPNHRLAEDPPGIGYVLDVEYAGSNFKFERTRDQLEHFSAAGLTKRPPFGHVDVIAQPLATQDSVGTFDIVISNEDVEDARIGSIRFLLSADKLECTKPPDARLGEQTVDSFTAVDLNSGLAMVKGDNPIFSESTQTFLRASLCADITLSQGYTIAAKTTTRMRVNFVSRDVRCKFNKYSAGEGPYTITTPESGTVYESTPRLQLSDLRYYDADVEIRFEPKVATQAWGSLRASGMAHSNQFPQDAQTVGLSKRRLSCPQ